MRVHTEFKKAHMTESSLVQSLSSVDALSLGYQLCNELVSL